MVKFGEISSYQRKRRRKLQLSQREKSPPQLMSLDGSRGLCLGYFRMMKAWQFATTCRNFRENHKNPTRIACMEEDEIQFANVVVIGDAAD